MKIYLIILLSLTTTFSSFAQIVKRTPFLDKALLEVNVRKMFDYESNEIDLEEIDGSPYLSEEFVSGIVYNDAEKYEDVDLRYNVYSDEIEILNPVDQSVSALLKNEDYSCLMHNRHFKYFQFDEMDAVESDGYFIVLNKGEMKLLMKYDCKYSEGKPSLNTLVQPIPPSFKISKKYYVLKDDSLKLLPTKKKKIMALFTNFNDEVNNYIKNNKLDIKEKRDIARIIAFYNSLEK